MKWTIIEDSGRCYRGHYADHPTVCPATDGEGSWRRPEWDTQLVEQVSDARSHAHVTICAVTYDNTYTTHKLTYMYIQVRLPSCEGHDAYNDAAIEKAEKAFEAERAVCLSCCRNSASVWYFGG